LTRESEGEMLFADSSGELFLFRAEIMSPRIAAMTPKLGERADMISYWTAGQNKPRL